jgi:hypothetical protein
MKFKILIVYLQRSSNRKSRASCSMKNGNPAKKISYVKNKKKNWPCLQGHGTHVFKILILNYLIS